MAPEENATLQLMFQQVREGLAEVKKTLRDGLAEVKGAQLQCRVHCEREMSESWTRVRALEDHKSAQTGKDEVRREQHQKEMEETQRQQTKAIILAAVLTGIITLLGTVMVHVLTSDTKRVPAVSSQSLLDKSRGNSLPVKAGNNNGYYPNGSNEDASETRNVAK